MTEPAVTNTSPLIVLTRIGYEHLLLAEGDRVIVPRAVADEVQVFGPDDPTVRALATHEWLRIIDTGPIQLQISDRGLGAGESAVLTWALAHPGTDAILDDDEARRFGRVIGVPVIGTLGLILRAKQLGAIPSARRVIAEARGAGLYLSDAVVDAALVRVRE